MTMYERDTDQGVYGDSWPYLDGGVHRRKPWRQAAREWAEDIAYAAGYAVVAVGVFAGLSWFAERLLG